MLKELKQANDLLEESLNGIDIETRIGIFRWQ